MVLNDFWIERKIYVYQPFLLHMVIRCTRDRIPMRMKWREEQSKVLKETSPNKAKKSDELPSKIGFEQSINVLSWISVIMNNSIFVNDIPIPLKSRGKTFGVSLYFILRGKSLSMLLTLHYILNFKKWALL